MSKEKINKRLIGKIVIVRTYSAGVWFGKVAIKNKAEIILVEARRLYYWKTKKGVSLSEVALDGLSDVSKVCALVKEVWLQPIEIIPCTEEASKDIKSKKSYVTS